VGAAELPGLWGDHEKYSGKKRVWGGGGGGEEQYWGKKKNTGPTKREQDKKLGKR